jgi:NAD dependent epimerase/dehydratase family enzyme
MTGATGFIGETVFSTLSKNYQLMYISTKTNLVMAAAVLLPRLLAK